MADYLWILCSLLIRKEINLLFTGFCWQLIVFSNMVAFLNRLDFFLKNELLLKRVMIVQFLQDIRTSFYPFLSFYYFRFLFSLYTKNDKCFKLFLSFEYWNFKDDKVIYISWCDNVLFTMIFKNFFIYSFGINTSNWRIHYCLLFLTYYHIFTYWNSAVNTTSEELVGLKWLFWNK